MNTNNTLPERPRFPEYIRSKEDYQLALEAHDWNYHRHLRLAGLQLHLEKLHIGRFKYGQQQRIAILHAASKYFDKDFSILNAALALNEPKETT